MNWVDRVGKRVWTVSCFFLPFWIGLFSLGTWASHRTAILSGRPASWASAARWNVAGYAGWAFVFTPIVLFLAWRFPIERNKLRNSILVHLAGALLVTALDALFGVVLHGFTYPQDRRPDTHKLFEMYFLGSLTTDIWLYCGLAITAHVISYSLRVREKEVRESQLEMQLARAQLFVLKMQLQPHFLFNTLHSISALMHKDVRMADRMITCLGDLLRMSIDEADVHEVTLKQELEFLDKYLEIQKIRFQGQLSVATTVDAEVLSAVVPYLLLQPLVENAIKHGIARRTEPGTISIDVRTIQERLLLTVTNDGPSVRAASNGNGGLGLNNMQARLHGLYGDDQHLRLTHFPDHRTQAEIMIPLKMADTNGNGFRSPVRNGKE